MGQWTRKGQLRRKGVWPVISTAGTYLLRLEQLARDADVDRGLLLVAREHPDLDAREREVVDGLGHAILQAVLDRARAEQLEPRAERALDLVHQRVDLVRQVVRAPRDLRAVVVVGPLSHRVVAFVAE